MAISKVLLIELTMSNAPRAKELMIFRCFQNREKFFPIRMLLFRHSQSSLQVENEQIQSDSKVGIVPEKSRVYRTIDMMARCQIVLLHIHVFQDSNHSRQ